MSDPRDTRSLITAPALLALAACLFHLLTSTTTGYFRDELYYLACASHLDWGYVDHPPGIAIIGALVRATLGDSLLAIRLFPALAAGATVWVVGRLVAVIGGGPFAQGLAALVTAVAPISLALASFFSMNVFDVLIWAVLWLLAARILRDGDERLWIPLGVVAGVGLQNKISVLFLAFGLAVGILLARRFELLRARRLWAGVGLAALIFSPHVFWQAANGWPTLEFMDNARTYKIAALPPGAFLAEVALLAGPGAIGVWLIGLFALLGARRVRAFQPLGLAFVAILLLLMFSRSKAYYVSPAVIPLFAAGACVLEAWTANAQVGYRRAIQTALSILVLGGGAFAAPLAKPLLPPEEHVRYAASTGIQPSAGERGEVPLLPQLYADRFGWRELAETVAAIRDTLPSDMRVHIFAQNYGQAGAIDHFGPALGLPPAVSGHNSYFLWGPGEVRAEDTWILIGGSREGIAPFFAHVELASTFACEWCMPYENGKRVWIARGLLEPVDVVWQKLKTFI